MHDRYRPTTWDGVVGQDVDAIRRQIDGALTPNFLFYGPPGTGKTTTAYLISMELQGSTAELMEFDASDDRGIETVRTEINPAVNQSTLSGAPRVVFLDEMDSMTYDAQQALRRPMEQSRAVFVLACNDRGAVHDAVESRCYPHEFGPVPDRAVRERIQHIAEREGVDLSGDEYRTIVSFANGDMRAAITRYNQVARGAVADDDEPEPVADDGNGFEARARSFLED